MPPLRAFLKPTLVVTSATVAILSGFMLVPVSLAVKFVLVGGYFLILAAAIATMLALWRLFRTPQHRLTWTAADWRLAALALVATVLWQVQEPHGFKVLMDEMVLTGTSMSMHFDREVFTPLKAYDVGGEYSVVGGILDKRPLFFPFLVSVLHDITGYRPANAFVLNGALSFVLLFLAGRVGRMLGSHENAGLLTVLLLAGLPLLGVNATGGGFELLNLVLLCGAMLLTCRFLRTTDAVAQDALVLVTVLLAQTRYESALYVPVVGLIVLWGWWRARRLVFSWGLVIAPLLLITIPLQQKLFEANPAYWELQSGAAAPFGLRFMFENLGHAMVFFFTLDGDQAGSPVLAAIGLVSTLFALLFLLRRWRTISAAPEQATFAWFAAAILAGFGLLLAYHWGQLDDFVATRLALPTLLLFALSAAFVFGRWVKRPLAWRVTLTTALAWVWLAAVPLGARAHGTRSFLGYQETSWQREFVRKQRGQQALFVMPSGLPAILERESALGITMLAERAEQMAYHLGQRTFTDVFVFQRLVIDPVREVFQPEETSRLGPEFVLETMEERRFTPLYIIRLSRLRAVDLSRQLPKPEGWKPRAPSLPDSILSEGLTPHDAFARHFILQLP